MTETEIVTAISETTSALAPHKNDSLLVDSPKEDPLSQLPGESTEEYAKRLKVIIDSVLKPLPDKDDLNKTKKDDKKSGNDD